MDQSHQKGLEPRVQGGTVEGSVEGCSEGGEASSEDQTCLRGGGADHEAKAGRLRGPGRRTEVTECGPNRGDAFMLSKEGGAEVGGELKYTGWRVSAGRVSQRGHTRALHGRDEGYGGKVKEEAQEGPRRLSLRAGVEEN